MGISEHFCNKLVLKMISDHNANYPGKPLRWTGFKAAQGNTSLVGQIYGESDLVFSHVRIDWRDLDNQSLVETLVRQAIGQQTGEEPFRGQRILRFDIAEEDLSADDQKLILDRLPQLARCMSIIERKSDAS